MNELISHLNEIGYEDMKVRSMTCDYVRTSKLCSVYSHSFKMHVSKDKTC